MVGGMQVRGDGLFLEIGAGEPDEIFDVLSDRFDDAVLGDFEQRPAGRRDVVLDGLEKCRTIGRLTTGTVSRRGFGQRGFGGGHFTLLHGMKGTRVGTVWRTLVAAGSGLTVSLFEQLAVLWGLQGNHIVSFSMFYFF